MAEVKPIAPLKYSLKTCALSFSLHDLIIFFSKVVIKVILLNLITKNIKDWEKTRRYMFNLRIKMKNADSTNFLYKTVIFSARGLQLYVLFISGTSLCEVY